ncbi:MAG: sodium ion-translocating decarboxylase subunit beta [Sediminispirochaetaceae bacterium]
MTQLFYSFFMSTGFSVITWQEILMIGVGLVLIYLGISKKYEPLLLVPIGFGTILVNLPLSGLMAEGGLLHYFYFGIEAGIFPPLIFMGIGAMTDFGPLLAKPKTFLLGAAAQFGIFVTLLGAKALGFNFAEAASIAIIGGADGPTAIYLTSQLADHLLGPVAVAAYSYMALVPIIQPPIIRAMTSKKERQVVMSQVAPVAQRTKIVFPIVTTIVSVLLIPEAAPLIGMLMLGNLFREAGVLDRLSKAAQNELINIVTIFLGISVGSKMSAAEFLNIQTLMIIVLGLIAFAIGTASGVLLGKIMYVLSGRTINPMIGAAGVSAVPMAARVVQKVGQEENPKNFLLMNAMGPNVAGVIGSAIAAGVLLSMAG